MVVFREQGSGALVHQPFGASVLTALKRKRPYPAPTRQPTHQHQRRKRTEVRILMLGMGFSISFANSYTSERGQDVVHVITSLCYGPSVTLWLF
jgi:hypothetical protein